MLDDLGVGPIRLRNAIIESHDVEAIVVWESHGALGIALADLGPANEITLGKSGATPGHE